MRAEERESESGREVKRVRLANKLRINDDDTDSKAKCRLNWKLAGPNVTTRRSEAEKSGTQGGGESESGGARGERGNRVECGC